MGSSEIAVSSPQALTALRSQIAGLDANTWAKGNAYFERRQVESIRPLSDYSVAATVQGSHLYHAHLTWRGKTWELQCSCPVWVNCKHAVAAGMEWLQQQGQPPPLRPGTRAARRAEREPYRPPMIAAFRDHWAPIAQQKLGRPLTAAEASQLADLAALHQDLREFGGFARPALLQRYGFGRAVPRGGHPFDHALEATWTAGRVPSDPWALWQSLAWHLEQNGAPIPEVFRPFTDTAAVQKEVARRELAQEIAAWRAALAPRPSHGDASATRVALPSALRARLGRDGRFVIETPTGQSRAWKPASATTLRLFASATAAELSAFPPAQAALATTLALHLTRQGGVVSRVLEDPRFAAELLDSEVIRDAMVSPDGTPLVRAGQSLQWQATSGERPDTLAFRLATADAQPASEAVPLSAAGRPRFYFAGQIWEGPPPLPNRPLPVAALADELVATSLREAGVTLPATLDAMFRPVPLTPVLQLAVGRGYLDEQVLIGWLHAKAAEPACELEWGSRHAWTWTMEPAGEAADGAVWRFERGAANAMARRFEAFRWVWNPSEACWSRRIGLDFPNELQAWRETWPADVVVEVTPELNALLAPAPRAWIDFTAAATGRERDWFDVTIALRTEDTTLTPDEIALLLRARGRWVRLKKGWQRLDVSALAADPAAAGILDRLGLTAVEVAATGRPETHRVHALQLAGEAPVLEATDAALARALRAQAAALTARPAPPVPATLRATLRPYQQEGYRFLCHLAAHGLGGVLADDMGLGKTVQTLAWLLHLQAELPRRVGVRALVVCPKSVVHGWESEAARFAPDLKTTVFTPELAARPVAKLRGGVLIANYTQLRLHAAWFAAGNWDAVVLDEAQFIKNPASQVAVAVRALPARHRVVLTGTPIENRLTDLWSLFAFAQPGLLGTAAAFRRQYDPKDPGALGRLRQRVRHFLLRRTKQQAAPDLPPRTEDELVVDLDGAQRKLYDAELKRARQILLGIETDAALDGVRFNLLASLLRLRQICCHPALVDRAHAALPSAKLDALIERLEELQEEGHQVLVFSQFVTMLDLIRARLDAAGIGHLSLTGATENRAELVAQFQTDPTRTVFLLSLKAAGFGLNLTAASYAVLYDPWWNPAAEAQALDRMHRIGQTKPVIAYRLLARDTVEQKIRALQQEKAQLAAAVVQEESLASVLDLDSLRRILG